MAEIVDRLHHHDTGKRVDPRHAVLVFPACGDDAGGHGAVAVIVPGLVVIVEEVPADRVVDIAVVIVVDAVAGDFLRVVPQAVLVDVLMVPVETGVDDGDHDRLGIAFDKPPGGIGAGIQADALQRPLIRIILAP